MGFLKKELQLISLRKLFLLFTFFLVLAGCGENPKSLDNLPQPVQLPEKPNEKPQVVSDESDPPKEPAIIDDTKDKKTKFNPKKLLRNFKSASPEECLTFRKSLLQNHAGKFTLGYAEVPEDWNVPNGRTTHVFFYYRPATLEPIVNNIPVLFFNGGPGSKSHGNFSILEATKHFRQAPLMYMDQRGTGCSEEPPSFNHTAVQEDEVLRRLRNYGSRSIVQDAEFIRKAVFGADQKWRLVGSSYGAHIVHRYLELNPDSIHSAFAHGFAVNSDLFDDLWRHQKGQNKILQAYMDFSPQMANNLKRFKDEVEREQVLFSNGATLNSIGTEIGTLLSDPRNFLKAASTASQLLDKQGKINTPWIISNMKGKPLNGEIRSLTINRVVWQMDILQGHNGPDLCSSMDSHLKTLGLEWVLWAPNNCLYVLEEIQSQPDLNLGEVKGDPVDMSVVRIHLAERPTLKFRLYSGYLDIISPSNTFEPEVDYLGNLVYYTKLQKSGHSGLYYDKEFIRDYLEPVAPVVIN